MWIKMLKGAVDASAYRAFAKKENAEGMYAIAGILKSQHDEQVDHLFTPHNYTKEEADAILETLVCQLVKAG